MFRASTRGPMTGLAVVAAATLALSGCSASKVLKSDGGNASGDASPVAKTFEGSISMNVRPGATSVKVNRHVKVRVSGAQLQSVTLRGPGGAVPGTLATDSSNWHATGFLRPASKYVVSGIAVGDNGIRKQFKRSFRTQKLTLDQQTYPSFTPIAGDTVGIAMPVIVRFDVPVTDKKQIQQHLQVTSTPAQPGAWHWISDNEVHWRPKNFWKAGTKVNVKADIAGVPAGNGIYGQLNRQESFTVGRAQVLKVNTRTDQMSVVRNGKTIRTIPITTGKQPEFTTRSGIKVIIEKDRRHDMNSETIGIDPNSANGYNLKGVEFAMRLTYSGEFLHAAPWSVSSQGHANVSHGCTGMSTANAGWLFENSLIGDPVIYTGTDKPMTLTNGYGDWNESFADYAKGSAL